MIRVLCQCVTMHKCGWHLCVRVRKRMTAVDTVLMCVMPLACNCVVMRIGSVCNYTKVGDVPV